MTPDHVTQGADEDVKSEVKKTGGGGAQTAGETGPAQAQLRIERLS